MHKLNCVLLIDDDSTANYLHKIIIADLEIAHRIYCCKSGKEALTFLEQCIQNKLFPELIFIDRKMPIMDGFEFLEAYIERAYHTRYTSVITMLTTQLNPTDIIYLNHIGFVKPMCKPLTEEHLLEVVQAYSNKKLLTKLDKRL